MSTPRRVWLLAPAGLALLAGLDAALLLVGVPAPVTSSRLEDLHGGLMVLCFLGGLIALERAVALGAPAGYGAPALLGLGGVALLLPGMPPLVGKTLVLAGLVALVAVYTALWRRKRDDPVLVEGLGAAVALCAAILWLRVDLATTVPWLAGFVILTIAAERVELARLVLPASADLVLVVLAGALVVALVAALLAPGPGARALGIVVLLLVAWLARHDVARHTIRLVGLPRFSAAALLVGYVWLAVAGLVWALVGAPRTTPAYDAVVHTVFLGFAMSMVMAHAPVILPAVARRPLPYHPVLWVPLVVLHAGLVLRVLFGDGLGIDPLWRAGSLVTVAALLLMVVTNLALVVTARSSSGSTGRSAPRARVESVP
ncbi:conserved membrane hypothetical protein [Nostocoides japonicum T1-X7]|uniref:NnrS family protein n=1 Tax=Nostocoides japonicum T1-X7 TaxID=1194083 RepID=A0A077LYW1_9MICO|nr:hypothetical protein [Tetrasphaera japonica]CCH78092.1 conserved membrane hypothetical protein [Tetrasphaera japonica T1-X7]